MGWSFPYDVNSRRDLIRSLTVSDANVEILRSCIRGNVIWTLRKKRRDGELYIGCDLIVRHPEPPHWGYKALAEDVYPYAFSCPISYLEEAPVANQAWRDQVYAYHRERKQR